MRIWIRIAIPVALATAAILAAPPPDAGPGIWRDLRDAGWLPRNAVAAFILDRHAATAGSMPDPERSGDRQRAQDDLRWLRATEIYPPANPGLYMDTRRALGHAYALAGNPDRAAERMLEAARHPNSTGLYGGTITDHDWEAAIRLSYQAHGLDTALEVWREGRDAIQRNEDLYLAAATEDGSVLTAQEDGIAIAPPPWWDRRLDAFEARYSGAPRTWLVEQLLDAGEIDQARALADAIEADGTLGWPLTLAQIRISNMDPHCAGQDAQTDALLALTAPLLDARTATDDDLASVGEPDDEFVRVLRLHERASACVQ